MKKLLLCSVVTALFGTPTWAADMPVKAPPPPPQPPVFGWTGCYVGGNVGGASARGSFTTTFESGDHLSTSVPIVNAAGTGSDRDAGFIGGGQIGCNWQTGGWVWGIEGDFDGLSTRPSFFNSGFLSGGVDTFTIRNSVTNDWLATVRGRAGLAVDRSLFFVTAGAAFSDPKFSQVYTDTLAGPTTGGFSTRQDRVGWTVGGGWEYAFTDRWSFKIEYLHVGFGNLSETGLVIAAGSGNTNVTHGTVREEIDIGRVGLNYRLF